MAPGTKKPKKTDNPDPLRREAEEDLAQRPPGPPVDAGITRDKLVHELQVHQVELEMQNEALRDARLALEESRDKYIDLYEFAPVGYLTLSKHAVIEDANLTAASLLGSERGNLANDRFRKFVAPGHLDRWDRHFVAVLRGTEKQGCNLELIRKDGTRFPARLESVRVEREAGDPVIRMVISDITAQARGEERQKIFRKFTENAQDFIFFIRKRDGMIIEANQKATEVYGYTHGQFLGMTVFALRASDPRKMVEQQMDTADATGILFETVHRKKDGSDLPVEVNSFSLEMDGEVVLFSIVRDITDRKRAEEQQALTNTVLHILNRFSHEEDSIGKILHAIRQSTRIEAVGIRLKHGEDYPYYETLGFSDSFFTSERSLCGLDASGNINRDADGRVILECMCGNIISGRTDQKYPFFTTGGSFWCNNTTELLASTTETDRQAATRNRCNREGYESVALIPLGSREKVIGLLQLNDHRKNMFTLPMIEFFESLGNTIGIAFERQRAEETIARLSEERKALIDNVPAMIWYKDTHNNFIRVNPAGARTFGSPAEAIEGKSAYELFPEDAEHFYRDDLEVINSGVPKFGIIEQMPTAGGERIWVRTEKIPMKDEKGTVTGLLVFAVDITAIKQAEEELTRRSGDISAANEKLIATGKELRRNEAKLTASLEEKEILLSEIHHRVKNNLAAFISLLALDGTYEESVAGQRLKTDLQNRARSMALIHETLYRTRKFSNVDMGVYLTTLTEQIAGTYQSAKSIRTIVEAEGISLDLARATPSGLIVNELVTNAFKYAFPEPFHCETSRHEPCTLRISLTHSEGYYLLSVRDNGVGLPETFDPATAKSLGLKLVNFLAKHQLRAKVGVARENGTEFSIRFREKVSR